MATFPVWAAIRTVKSKIGTWVGYEAYRQLVPELTREEWARAIGEARAAIASRSEELTKPLTRRPVIGTGEVIPIARKTGSGFWQHVEVFTRDRDTGIISTRYFTVKSDTLRSRQSVISDVIGRFQESIDADPDNYPEDIVGVAYTGTYQIIRR